jgi:hypothetical protein
MDTRAIASEIVYLKNRLADGVDDSGMADSETERNRLHERLRVLQDTLSAKGEANEHAPDNRADKVEFIKPA